MQDSKQLVTLDMKARLSTLWIFALLNVIFRDIHEFFRPGMLDEVLTGVVNGVIMTEEMLLVAGILLEIPILMVILSRVLTYRWNRWANLIAPVLTVFAVVANGVNDLDDMWFIGVVTITLLVIMWTAWRWRKPQLAQ